MPPISSAESSSSPTPIPGSSQVAPDDVGEEQAGADQRDDRQDRAARQHRVDVGVRQAGEAGLVHLVLADGQAVAVQPVGDRLEQHEDAQQHRQVHPGRGRGALAEERLQPQPAVQVVGDRGGDQAHDHHGEREAEHEPVPGQVEGEERDVLAELRVLLAEGHPVAPQQEGAPLPRRGRAADQTDAASRRRRRRAAGTGRAPSGSGPAPAAPGSSPGTPVGCARRPRS